MLTGKVHESQHFLLVGVYQAGQLWHLGAKLVSYRSPLGVGRGGILLGIGRADPGGDDAALGFARMGGGVAAEMHAAPLRGGPEYLGHRGLEAMMGVGDDKLDAAQTTPGLGRRRAQYSLIMSHPQHHADVFGASFEDPEDLVVLIDKARKLGAAVAHFRSFTPKNLLDHRLVFSTLEEGCKRPCPPSSSCLLGKRDGLDHPSHSPRAPSGRAAGDKHVVERPSKTRRQVPSDMMSPGAPHAPGGHLSLSVGRAAWLRLGRLASPVVPGDVLP